MIVDDYIGCIPRRIVDDSQETKMANFKHL